MTRRRAPVQRTRCCPRSGRSLCRGRGWIPVPRTSRRARTPPSMSTDDNGADSVMELQEGGEVRVDLAGGEPPAPSAQSGSDREADDDPDEGSNRCLPLDRGTVLPFDEARRLQRSGVARASSHRGVQREKGRGSSPRLGLVGIRNRPGKGMPPLPGHLWPQLSITVGLLRSAPGRLRSARGRLRPPRWFGHRVSSLPEADVDAKVDAGASIVVPAPGRDPCVSATVLVESGGTPSGGGCSLVSWVSRSPSTAVASRR